MQTFTTIAEYRAARQALGARETVGLVPTMGYLHTGHLALVAAARAANDRVVVSIFVNPTQFGPHEDFARYPRDEARDLALLDAAGVDWVFLPSVDEMYPQPYYSYVDVRTITERLEGAMRPGHFLGVATVVAKLFNIVQPTRAYFGQKDAQQVTVIRQMVRDLNFPLEIVVCPIVREPDGLAMSSRNVYLDADQRKAATVLYRSLSAARNAFESGEREAEKLRQIMKDVLATEPLARMQYVSCADYDM